MEYMEHVGSIDPTSPMGYVGSLSEIEQAMLVEHHHLHPSPGGKGGKGGKGGRGLAYPELDEKRALHGPRPRASSSSSSSSLSSSAAASRRRKPRCRPASAGRMRHSASAPQWHTSVRAGAANKKSGGRRRRPASAGRMRRSGSAAVLTSMTNNLQYGSGPGTLGNGGGRKRVRLQEIRQRAKQLEQGWNQTFAQNLVSNQMIMGSTEEVGTSRRRDWMNHHADQFSALNELRRAILQNREGGGGGGGGGSSSVDARGRSSSKSKSCRSKPNANNASTPNKKRVIRKLAKKKKKNKKKKQQSSTKNLMLVDKTRMQSRRLQKKSKGTTSTPQLGYGHGNDDNYTSEDDSDLHQGYAGDAGDDDGFDDEQVKAGAELGEEDALSKARHLSEMRFVKQCKAVRVLFEDLKVPQRDRRFFTKTFMARYDERCAAFVQEQAELLDGHRRRTLRVLSRIRRREMAIKQLHAVAKACVTGIVPSMEAKSHGQGGSAEIASMKAKHRQRFRAILEDAARRAQTASCLVVEAIVPWRKDLWRPQPFKWNGKNYILRMGNCVGLQKFVTNADYVRAIRMCELPAGTLDVLLPPNVCEELCANTQPPKVNVADEGKDKSEKDDAAAVVAAEAAAESPSPAGDHERMSSVRISAACMVIQQEPQVVKELRKELDELVEKGYFIPRLRWNPNKLQSESQGDQGI